MFDLTIANTLPNGAQIIDRSITNKLVLAYYGGVLPYTVWRVDNEGNAFWGGYFKTYDEAKREYVKRLQT